MYLAEAWAALGDSDRAIGWLQRYTPRTDTHFQMHLQCDPLLDPLGEDPRFRALLLRLALMKTTDLATIQRYFDEY